MGSSLLDGALLHANRGLPVFPLKPRGKTPLTQHGHIDATTDADTIRKWWAKWPDANIGIRCDGLLVADFDGYKGQESRALLESQHGELPNTWTIKTGGGTDSDPKEPGQHLVFKAPAGMNIRPGAGKYGFENLDIRANDSYIVASPSITRLPYEIIENTPIGEAPAWLVELARVGSNGSRPARKAQRGTPIPDTTRNVTLTSLAGTMRRRGMAKEAIEAALLAIPCEPPLPEDEIRKIATSVGRYEPAKPPAQTREDIINLIRAFTGQANTISIPRALLDFFDGDYPTAILCNQLLYWQDKQGREDGGIYKTYKDWGAEIGLSEYQVRRAANKLKKRGFLETRLHKANGVPTVHYYFNVATFSESILEFLQNPILSFSRIQGKETPESLTDNTA